MWSEKAPERATTRDTLERIIFPTVGEIQIRSLTIRKLTLTGENAIVRVTLDISAPDLKTNAPSPYFGMLKRTLRWSLESGQWRVWSYLTDERELADRLLQAATDTEREQLLATEPELMTTALLGALIDRQAPYTDRMNFEQGLAHGRFLIGLAEKLNDKAQTARVFHTLSVIHKRNGDSSQAMKLAEQGLKLAEETGAMYQLADLLNLLGGLQSNLGQYDQAAESLNRAIETAERINNKMILANSLTNLGVLQWKREHFTEAIKTNLKGQALAEELGARNLSALIQGNLGTIYFDLGEYNRALASFQQSLNRTIETKDQRGENAALINIGNAYLPLGDYQRSLEYLDRGLKLAEQLQDSDRISQATQTLGNVYFIQQNWSQAMALYRKSMAIAEQTNDLSVQAQPLPDLADCQFRLGDHTTAIETLQRALALHEKLGLKIPTAMAWYNLGNIYSAQTQYSLAMECVQKGLKLAEEAGLREALAEGIYNQAALLFKQKQYERAAALAEQSAIKSAELQTPLLTQAAHTLAGRCYLADLARGNDRGAAKQHFTTAIGLIEKMRQQVGGGETERQSFFASKLAPYHGMVALAVGQGRPAEALAYAQHAQARVLLDSIQNQTPRLTAKTTDDERRQEEQLRLKMAELNLRLQRTEKKTLAEQKELQDQLGKARLAYEDFHNRLLAAHPDIGVRRSEFQPLTLAEIGKLLPNDQTAILSFALTEENAYLFVLTKGQEANPNLAVHTLNIAEKELKGRIEQFRKQLADRDLNFREPAAELYKLLIQPAQAELAGRKNLILIPDGELWALPFQALMTSAGRYLLEEHSVSFAPSLPVLHEMAKLKRRGDEGSGRLLALGNPTTEQIAGAASTNLLSGRAESLPQLEEQIKTLGKMYGANTVGLFSGKDASETRFKAEAGKYRILHLATHGFLNDASPMYSALQLSADKQEDGRLEAWEIMNLSLQADVAVLAACETARGQIGKGEGMIGLSWAFLMGGCPTVVSSL